MQEQIAPDQISAVECRFATYIGAQDTGGDDFHFVKEIIHTKDNRQIPNLRAVKNFQRQFWITKKGYRKHKEKKEWEFKDRVTEHKSSQSQLMRRIAMALEKPWLDGKGGGLRKLCRDPYVYGADIASTALVKRRYQDRFPETTTLYSVACFDTETNVFDPNGPVIMATLSFKDRVFTAIDKSFLAGYSDIVNRLQLLLTKYLDSHVKARNIKWEICLADDEADCIIKTINKAHEWQPDFLAIWNMDFDIPKLVKGLERAGYDPAAVFSDPSVPKEQQFFRYKQGPKQKVTASGKVTPIKPAAQWHTVFTPASFYVIDAMCAYRHIRTGEAEEPSYGLDAILKKHQLGGKLKFAEADHAVSTLNWHQIMQKDFKLEYVVYNVFDCVSMEQLDEKTMDLSLSLPSMSGSSDFENFKSQPRRVVDELHFFVQKYGRVIGTTSDEMKVEDDELTVGLEDWIKERLICQYCITH